VFCLGFFSAKLVKNLPGFTLGDISIIEFINGVFGKDYTHIICLHNDIINEMNRIVITGGHLTPALLVIKELQKRGNWQIFYLGRKYATEGSRTPSVESKNDF